MKSYLGYKFNNLTVVSETVYRTHNNNRYREVKTRCVCGKEKYIGVRHLLSGGTKSCGCIGKFTQRMSNLTGKEIEIINGLLLSDATIGGKSGFFIKICNKSKEYLQYLRDNISIFNGREIYKYQDKNDNSVRYFLSSLSYKDFIPLRKKWYPKGIKIVPDDIILTPETCLHWYIGDGNNGCNGQTINLHTEGFSRNNVIKLQNKLTKIGIISKIRKRIVTKTFGYGACLAMGRLNMIKFLNYIEKCPVKYFRYKWNLSNKKINGVNSIKNKDSIRKIILLRKSGKTFKEIGDLLNIDKDYVWGIYNENK